MRIKKIILLIIFLIVFMSIHLPGSAFIDSEKQASDFQSNGVRIAGWHWLRDQSLQHTAEWIFRDIPSGDKLTLEMTALATDQASGGKGFDAHFLLIYGFPGSGQMGGLFKSKKVTLPNITPVDDPVGYTCRGEVTLDRSFIAEAQEILIRVERESSRDNHVAFKKASIKLLPFSESDDEENLPENDMILQE